MAGISSKAAGKLENKYEKFQGQPMDDDLGLNWYGFKWRNHDPHIGRFVQIDPLSEKFMYNSTYAFSENKVTNHIELEGLESLPAGVLLNKNANHHKNLNNTLAFPKEILNTKKTIGSYNVRKVLTENQVKISEAAGIPAGSSNYTLSLSETISSVSYSTGKNDDGSKYINVSSKLKKTDVELDEWNGSIKSISETISSGVVTFQIATENEYEISAFISSAQINDSPPITRNYTLSERLSENLSKLSPVLENKVNDAIISNAGMKKNFNSIIIKQSNKIVDKSTENIKPN